LAFGIRDFIARAGKIDKVDRLVRNKMES